MTAAQLAELPKGRFVVVDLKLHTNYDLRIVRSCGSNSARIGILSFKTAGAAGEFVERAREGLVLGRHTTVDRAQDQVDLLMQRAAEAYEAANRFLDLWVKDDGTVMFRESPRVNPHATWHEVKPQTNVMLDLVIEAMLARLRVPFKT